jgi:rod shape-determining protein MreC
MFRSLVNYRRLIVLVLFTTLIIFLLSPELQHRPLLLVERPVGYLVLFFQRGLGTVVQGISHGWSHYIALGHMYEENQRMETEIEQLKIDNTQLQEMAIANDRLTELLGFKQKSPFRMTAAEVIGRDLSNWYRTVMINKGEKDGVSRDMGVVTPAGVVGRIVKTSASYSHVLLLVDPNSAVAALVQRSREEGIVAGTEKGLTQMKYLSTMADVKVGDVVMTSGLAGSFPKGLPIGKVSRVENKQTDLTQQVEVIPAVDFSRLEEVLVITSIPF